jgi:hypothetical protein
VSEEQLAIRRAALKEARDVEPVGGDYIDAGGWYVGYAHGVKAKTDAIAALIEGDAAVNPKTTVDLDKVALATFFATIICDERAFPFIKQVAQKCGLLNSHDVATEAARRIYADLNAWKLGLADSAAFVAALGNPPDPNEALKAAAVRWKETTDD